MTSPPETETRRESSVHHGHELIDPYQWLEEASDAVERWERRQNDYTDAFVRTARREQLQPDFEAVGRLPRYFLPMKRGERYFQRIEYEGDEQPTLTVRSSLEETPVPLVEPEQFPETTNITWYLPDLDGRRLLYAVMDAGDEQTDFHLIEVDSGERLETIDGVGRCSPDSMAWDDDGFYYLRSGSVAESRQLDKTICYHEVRGDDRVLLEDLPRDRWPTLHRDRETGRIVVATTELGRSSNLYELDVGSRSGAASLDPVLTDYDDPFHPTVAHGRLYLVTTHGTPRGRVLATELEGLSEVDGPDSFETIIPESDDVLTWLVPAGERLGLARLRNAAGVLSIHEADGSLCHELALPELAGISRGALRGARDSPELFFELTRLDRPTAIAYSRVGEGSGPEDWQVLQRPELPSHLSPGDGLRLKTSLEWATSTDGTEVPLFVVHRSDLELDGSPPAVLNGYGGFRIPRQPRLRLYSLPFLADGGVMAIACLRGGFEFGERWHEEGMREQKPNTFADFEAAADLLVERGYTSHSMLAGWGGSNGGLTIGAALVRSPERFGAMICKVPLLDMLRFDRFLLGEAWTGEYGSPANPDAFEWLRAYSPYHNVDEIDYPATLLSTAAGDTRVHPGHARKMTARLQEKTTGDAPICFRSEQEAGHGLGTPTSLEIEQQLDQWTFLYEVFDIERNGSI